MTTKEKVLNYLRNEASSNDLLNIVSQINSYDGSFDDLQYWENGEDFFDTFFERRPMEVARAINYGNYNYTDDYVKFNAYGNLVSADEYQIIDEIRDYLEEITNWLLDNYQEIDYNLEDELVELLEEDEENEEDEE